MGDIVISNKRGGLDYTFANFLYYIVKSDILRLGVIVLFSNMGIPKHSIVISPKIKVCSSEIILQVPESLLLDQRRRIGLEMKRS